MISPPPFSCDRFSESRWQEFHFGVDTLQDVIATLMELWGIERKYIYFRFYTVQDFRIGWTDDTRAFSGSGQARNGQARQYPLSSARRPSGQHVADDGRFGRKRSILAAKAYHPYGSAMSATPTRRELWDGRTGRCLSTRRDDDHHLHLRPRACCTTTPATTTPRWAPRVRS